MPAASPEPQPVRIQDGPLRILTFGGYRNRQPLAYEPIRAALGDRIALVDDPAEAQILLIGHYADLDLFGRQILAMLAGRPGLCLVLLSEEPFWDSCWMPDPLSRHQRITLETGSAGSTVGCTVDCTVLNHATSTIYRAARIPYFLLTDSRYIARYRPMFDRNAGWTAADWQRHFRAVPLDAVFLAQRRMAARMAPMHGGGRLRGLSVWRSRIAEACQGPRVVIEGAGWGTGGGTAPRRQDLDDWHADKLTRFDLQTRYMSAFENSWQADYLTEKIWDAFAVGAVPFYAGGPDHAVQRLVGARGWLDFFDHLDSIPDIDTGCLPDPGLVDAYASRQEELARLFADRTVLEAEYDRLTTALLGALQGVLRGMGRDQA
jgi:hypothetical protein